MKISITLAIILLLTAFLILPTLMLVVFLRLPNLKRVPSKIQAPQNISTASMSDAGGLSGEGAQKRDSAIGSTKTQKALRVVAYICFGLYLIFLFTLVFGEVHVDKGYITVSLVKSAQWFSLEFALAHTNTTNLLYNLTMMFPVCAFVLATQKIDVDYKPSKYFLKVFLKTVLISFLISLFIETFQFVLPVSRTTELFDLLTNTLSGALGFCYFCPVVLVCNKLRHKAHRLRQQ